MCKPTGFLLQPKQFNHDNVLIGNKSKRRKQDNSNQYSFVAPSIITLKPVAEEKMQQSTSNNNNTTCARSQQQDSSIVNHHIHPSKSYNNLSKILLSSSLNNNTKNRITSNTRRKHLRFSEYCEVTTTLSRSDLTPEEKQQYWTSKREYEENINRLASVIMSDHRCSNGEQQTNRRGLELMSEYDAIKKWKNRVAGQRVVLSQQNFGYNRYTHTGRIHDFDNNESAIAKAYSKISIPCAIDAFTTAYHDHVDACM